MTVSAASKPTTPPTGEWTPDLQLWLQQRAAEAGFDAAGIASVAPPHTGASRLDEDRFTAWIDAGRAGEMDYLKRRDDQGVLLRTSIQTAIPWARSVIVCALNYNASAPLSTDPAPPTAGWIARYAWSGKPTAGQPFSPEGSPKNTDPNPLIPTDYHHELLLRLHLVEAALHQRSLCQTKAYVDTGPLVERSAAAKAGIGWIGKNTCIINQGLGSWLLLGVIVTSLPFPVTASLTVEAADRCGTCTRCLDACPTNALVAPRQMDASLCIAYLTIEKKGAVPEPLRAPMGRQVFGCDICQDVCPWNRRAPIAVKENMQPRPELVNPPLDWLAHMDATAFRRWFAGSPLERTRRKRLHRNVAIAMGNSGEQRYLPQLEQWTSTTAEDPILAEAAHWAIERLRTAQTSPEHPIQK